MFMPDPIEGVVFPAGIQSAHRVFDRGSDNLETFPKITTNCSIEFAFVALKPLRRFAIIIVIRCRKKKPQLAKYEHFALNTHEALCLISLLVAVLTVRALYAGTLVTCWTTAPSHQKRQNSSTLLAALCLAFAVLTIATRCYASKSATHHQLVQLSFTHNPAPTSSISKSAHSSSKIQLGKLFKLHERDNKLRNYYKYLLSSEKFKKINTVRKRRKREVQRTNANQNSAVLYDVIRNNSRLNRNQYGRNDLAGIGLVEYNRVKSVINDSEWNNSRVSDTLQQINERQNDHSSERLEKEERPTGISGIERPMPPALDNDKNSVSNESIILVLVVSALVLTVALGLVTCVLSHYRGGTAADPHDAGQTPTTAPMLSVVSAGAAAGVGGMDRLRGRAAARDLAATRDRQVRLHSVHTDIAINLPPSIALPDGEDHPFSSSRLHIRDSEQESEIYQKCIKPPPNRTVLESESPPPYRSSSAGLLGSLGSCSSSSSDWSGGSAPLVMRCHSMSSTSKRPDTAASGQKTDFIQRTVKIFTGKKSQPPPAPTLPVVVVPTRPRQTCEQQLQHQNLSGRSCNKPSV